MEISYWQSRWRKDKTGWHMNHVFEPLKKYWPRLNLDSNSTVLVPLCGKSLDVNWLADCGHRVIGVDVSDRALQRIMHRGDASFKKSTQGSFIRYQSPRIELWCGDMLTLKKSWLPVIDAIYDKAALIALPPETRKTYVNHLASLIEPHTQIFLNTFEYNQHEMTGPPFAVHPNEINRLFRQKFTIECLEQHSLFDELSNFQRRGLSSYLVEKIYRLIPL
jgi:thiopurine S-methyltransferase